MLHHTAAMRWLHAGVDTSVIALWLGHETVDITQIYLHADLALKERALARTTPPDSTPDATDHQTASSFLQGLRSGLGAVLLRVTSGSEPTGRRRWLTREWSTRCPGTVRAVGVAGRVVAAIDV